MDKIYKELGTDHDYMVDLIGNHSDSILGNLPTEYSAPIAEKIADDVARDVWETADREDWSMGDVALAVGRVLCKKLGIAT